MKDDNKKLVPDEDYEYEKTLAEQARERQRALEEAEQRALEERAEREKQEQKERDKRLAQERIELMKLKNGVIEESESIKEEEHEAPRELHGKEKIANIWYHNKIWILFGVFIFGVVLFILIDELTRVRPDVKIMMIANNGLTYRQADLETFFEKYADDLNGDGEVKVTVMMMPLDPNSKDYQTQSGYQAKFLAQLQVAESMMIITDSNIETDFLSILKDDLSKDFPGNKYIDAQGLSLNFKFLADELKFENMPYDVHLSMRAPISTLNTSLEEMQESYDTAFVMFKRIVDDLTKRAEELNDPGLTTPPASRPASLTDSSSSASDSSTPDTSK